MTDIQVNVGDEFTGKLTIPLSPPVERALQAAVGATYREPSDIASRALIGWLVEHKHLVGKDAEDTKVFWFLIDAAVAEAQAICKAGTFDEDITLRAVEACCAKPEWLRKYGQLVGPDNVWKTGVVAKGGINREIGFRIRAGIGGVTLKLADGKTSATKRCSGQIIQSYTPMDDYDQSRFGCKRVG